MFLPAVIVLSGMVISRIGFYKESPTKVLTPSIMPLPNKLLVNQQFFNTIYSDTQPSVLWQNLPESTKSFKFANAEDLGKNMTFKDYQKAVINYGNQQVDKYPYLYASYEAF